MPELDAALDDAMDAMYRDSGALTGGSKAARVANTALSRTALCPGLSRAYQGEPTGVGL